MSEMKNKLFVWIKKNRYYIVLALCILAVGGTYLLLSRAPTQLQQHSRADAQDKATENAPLPDLADYFPPELEPDAIEEKRNPESTQNAVPKQEDDSALQASANTEDIEKAPLVYVWPVEGEVQKPYSGTTLVYSNTMSDWRTHTGMDIRAEIGAEVSACADGVIEQVYTDARMGVTVTIDHGDGLKSVYANLSNGNLIREGQKVRAGEVISTVGTSALFEAADEPHLHFEMQRDGEPIDPAAVLY